MLRILTESLAFRLFATMQAAKKLAHTGAFVCGGGRDAPNMQRAL